jgi:type II secretory ATPase GspE/PulE/Tfp pilus assembly ATPase PilB-like protein
VTGPTGSGKTTTLYAALAATRDETKNVITVEDPVEYELPGVNQTNVHPEIGLTFAAQLRSILRQDPDVILVGEIRDGDTADIAIRAALTGHLVLSTLHTNSAVAAVTRLQDMEVPAFLIASSLSGVIAQRLVRLICRDCRTPYDQTTPEYDAWRTRLNLEPGFPLFFGAGCDACKGRGTRGRLAIIELLAVERDIRRAIMNQVSSMELRDIAIKNGMRTLWQDALEKLRQGLTTPDEVARVLLGTEEGVEEIAELPIEAGSTPDAASAT